MTFNGALVALGATRVLVVAVQPWVLEDPYETELIQLGFQLRCRCSVVLMAQDVRGRPRFHGDARVTKLLRRHALSDIAWRRFSLP